MSFFPSSERKTNLEINASPSPCDYNPSLSHSKAFGCAPFGSTQKLNRSINAKKEMNPELSSKPGEEVYSLNDLNVRLKKEKQKSSVFKSTSSRFQQDWQEKPGPGQYQLSNQSLVQSRSHPIFTHSHLVNPKLTVPSIPIDNLGFKEDENNQMKKVIPEVQSDREEYNPQSSFNSKGVVPWKMQSLIKKTVDRYPGPGDYSYQIRANKSISSCFASTTDRFGKSRKVKEEKVIPGPGAYNYSAGLKTNSSKNTQSFFNSKTVRFQKDNFNNVGPGSYFQNSRKSHSVTQIKRVFGGNNDSLIDKKVQRNTLFDVANKNPGPGEYKTNYGMSYQVQKMVLRKQATDVLPKEKRNVFDNKESKESPGPGAYQLQIEKKKVKGKLWKKTEVVNLKEESEVSPSPAEYTNTYKTIEEKIKLMNSKLTLTDEKPFNSGTERFQHYSKPQQIQEDIDETEVEMDMNVPSEGKKVKRLVMTTIKVKVPFGISSNKFQDKGVVYDGPDFYNKTSTWVKPSFNIKSRLN